MILTTDLTAVNNLQDDVIVLTIGTTSISGVGWKQRIMTQKPRIPGRPGPFSTKLEFTAKRQSYNAAISGRLFITNKEYIGLGPTDYDLEILFISSQEGRTL